MKRAAVVIGIRKTGGLPLLEDAIKGAERITNWLVSEEKFDVTRVTDEKEPVTVDRLYQAVARVVEARVYEQLVIYFAGHGFVQGSSEYWLLSDAPRNPNQAVVLEVCVLHARNAGIPSVVFISDACRSTVTSLPAQRLHGGVVFPNEAPTEDTDVRVDCFYATHVGGPAYEIPVVDGKSTYEAVYTRCFRKAFNSPPADLRRTVSVGGKSIEVVPNRRLPAYLRARVAEALKGKALKPQVPHANIQSEDDVFIGRVQVVRSNQAPPPIVEPGPVEVSQYAFGLISPPTQVQAAQLAAAAAQMFDASEPFVGESGHDLIAAGKTVLRIRGADVAWALGLGCTIRVDAPTLEIQHERPTASVLLGFTEGTGAVVAALDRHAATVVVADGRVQQVAYVPLPAPACQPPSEDALAALARLRRLATQASRGGNFRVETRAEAERLAGKLRANGRIDPTLGLLAAYAFSASGHLSLLKDLRDRLTADTGGTFYDVALLAGDCPDGARDRNVAPFMPMLRQGWPLLRGRRGVIPEAAERASEHLLDGLWTTFDARGMDILRQAADNGALT